MNNHTNKISQFSKLSGLQSSSDVPTSADRISKDEISQFLKLFQRETCSSDTGKSEYFRFSVFQVLLKFFGHCECLFSRYPRVICELLSMHRNRFFTFCLVTFNAWKVRSLLAPTKDTRTLYDLPD